MPDIWSLIRPNVKTLVPYSPGKSSEEVMRELGLSEVTKLASNENPLGPSPAAVEAAGRVLSQIHIYPDPAWLDLRAALAAFYNVDPAGILVGRGSDEVIHMLGLSLLSPGDQVIYSLPPFALYPSTTTLMEAEHVTVPSRPDHGHDLEAMAAAITPRTKLVILGNPCNPTGTIARQPEVDWFMEQVPEHCLVAFDEAYAEYVEDPLYPDTLRYAREGRLTMTLRTFSKAYGLAGLRIGYGIADPEVARAIGLTCEPFNASNVSLAAAVAALADRDHVARSVASNSAGKRQLYAAFEALGLTYVPTEANFILVDTGLDSRACFDGLMRRGVTVRTGDIFGPRYQTWIRVTIGTEAENDRFIAALKDVLAA